MFCVTIYLGRMIKMNLQKGISINNKFFGVLKISDEHCFFSVLIMLKFVRQQNLAVI
jgi:hypothetical protein